MFREVADKFAEAERSGHIPPGTLSEIDKILSILRTQEEYWNQSTNIDQRDAFALYHAFRNARLVAQAIRGGVERAPESHDNPDIAKDGLKLIPTLEAITTLGESLKAGRISEAAKKEIYNLVLRLRRMAKAYNLLPSEREEREGVEKADLKKQSAVLKKTIETTIVMP